jgi:hypothetical protein
VGSGRGGEEYLMRRGLDERKVCREVYMIGRRV